MRRFVILFAIVSGAVASSLMGCSSYEQAKVRGSNIYSMMAICEVSVALEQYRHDHGAYPVASSIAELRTAVAPLLDQARSADRWGEPLVVEVTAESYVVSSKGDDRAGGHEYGGAVSTPGHSITMKDARFVQYDASVERTARKLEGEISAARGQNQTAPTGIWRGTSTCTDRVAAPACKDEVVVYEFTAGAKPGTFLWKADKVVDGQRLPMGELDLAYDTGEACWLAEFKSPRSQIVWCLVVDGAHMTGTGRMLPGKQIVRKIDVRKD